jgi:hypothetical protein
MLTILHKKEIILETRSATQINSKNSKMKNQIKLKLPNTTVIAQYASIKQLTSPRICIDKWKIKRLI